VTVVAITDVVILAIIVIVVVVGVVLPWRAQPQAHEEVDFKLNE
jgi:hypothetical protein